MKLVRRIRARKMSVVMAALAMLLVCLAGTASSRSTAAVKTAPNAASLIDINRATLDELKTLPGIGDAYAGKIVKNRPYLNKTQLSSKGVIPVATYARIRALIIAKQ